MANTDAAFGAKPVRHLTGGTIRANEWKILGDGTSSSNIFTGDFVKLGATGYIDVAAAGNRLLGVFAGCSYTNSSGEQVYSKYYPASTTAQNSGDITAYVYDDPNIVFAIQSSGSADFADIGNLADIVAGTGSTTTGHSKFEINGTTGTGSANLRILGLYNEPKNAYGTNGVLEAVIWEHELIGHDQGTAGV
jgi:hypothetical protein|tara:strand:- start:1186 stop:1761 length:576 start_codon:yes stop_codon:yes gene_type:complete